MNTNIINSMFYLGKGEKYKENIYALNTIKCSNTEMSYLRGSENTHGHVSQKDIKA